MLKVTHFWQRVFVFGIFLGLLLAACAPEIEPAPTPRPTATEPEPAPTIEVEPTIKSTPTELPAAEVTVTAETPPTSEPGPDFESLGPLPISQELDLTIVNQWGGAPQSLALDGTTAYIGFGPRLFVIDVSDPAAPQLLGQSSILPDLIRGVDVAGNLVYLAAGSAGLLVLDAGDPAAMTVVNGGPNYAAGQPANAQNVTVIGDVAYVVDFNRFVGQTTLHQFDVSEPGQVALLDSYALPANASVLITEELIIVTGMDQMQLRDAGKPASIMSETPLASGTYTSRATLQGDIVTVAECCAPSGIERFDVSDPFHPAALGPLQELDLIPPYHAAAEGQMLVTASIFGEFGYCQSTVNFLEIGDENSELAAPLDPENCLNDLALDGDKLYLVGRSGLQIYDVSDVSNPILLGHFRHPAGFHDVQSLARRDGATYVLNAEGRSFELSTLNLSEQPPDLVLGRQTIGQEALLDLYISGDSLVIPVWMGSLYTLDISDPAAPQLLRRPVDGELYSGDLFAIALMDETLYVPVVDGVSVGAVGALDLSDPANPALAATVETGDAQILNLALNGETLVALSQGEESHITLYDVSQPLAPEQIAVLTMPEYVSRLAIVGDILYAACDFYNCQSIYAIDVSARENPDIISRWTLPFGVRDMVVDEQGAIYLVTSEQRIWSMDGNDPARLRLTGAQQLPGEFNRLKIEGDQIYAAAFDGGLYQVQVER